MLKISSSVYASNLHHGGGASGAAQFVSDLPALWHEGSLDPFDRLFIEVSSTVAANVGTMEGVRAIPVVDLVIRDDVPGLDFLRPSREIFDSQLIIRGPHYGRRVARRVILGFADATMVFPAPDGIKEGVRSRAGLRLKNVLKRRLLGRYDGYVVQTDRLAGRLKEIVGPKSIEVIPNSPSDIFTSFPDKGFEIPTSPSSSRVRLAYPARGYPHKNHEIIGLVGSILEAHHGVELEVTVTLRDEEMASLSADAQRYCRNVGERTVAELPEIYAKADGCLFLSLNETASATPLEAMAMRVPLIASDRPFVRDVARDVPYYFEPTDARDVAAAILRFVSDQSDIQRRLDRGVALVAELPGPMQRSRRYISALLAPI